MNTTITLSPDHGIRPDRPQPAGCVRSEWIKLRSIRSTPIFVGARHLVGVAMSLILGKVVKTDPYDHLPFTIGNTFLVSTWLTTLFAVVAGTLLFTSEVQHGTLAGALTARPRGRPSSGPRRSSRRHSGRPWVRSASPAASPEASASGMDTGDMSGAGSAASPGRSCSRRSQPVLGLGVGLLVRHQRRRGRPRSWCGRSQSRRWCGAWRPPTCRGCMPFSCGPRAARDPLGQPTRRRPGRRVVATSGTRW